MGQLTQQDAAEGMRLWERVDEAMREWLEGPDLDHRGRFEAADQAEQDYHRWRLKHDLPLPVGAKNPDRLK